MTDKEVYDKYKWEFIRSSAWRSWSGYVKLIPTNHLTRYIKYSETVLRINSFSKRELKTRTDIPEELKLEVLLLIGD